MTGSEWSKIKVVSWDIDGTLYDLHAFMGLLKKDLLLRALTFRWWSLVFDLVRLVRFKRHMDKVRKMAPEYRVGSVPGREAIGRTMDRIYGRLLPSIGILPGVEDTLAWVASTQRQQVVFSDYRQSTKLVALGLEESFSRVYAGEDLGHLKPAEDVFRAIIDDLGIEPHELLHIGDRQDTDGDASGPVGFHAAIIGQDYTSCLELLANLQEAANQ